LTLISALLHLALPSAPNQRLCSVLLFAAFLLHACQEKTPSPPAQPITHHAFTQILEHYVDSFGKVDYASLQRDSNVLNDYLSTLSNNPPNDSLWSRNEQLAYWINAYNAFTLQLIIRHYPIESIKDITVVNIPRVHSPWDIPFIRIGKQRLDLNHIEHDIIRGQFHASTAHFALVCAAESCPPLRREAFEARTLDAQLQDQGQRFVNDTRRNLTGDPQRIQLSKIFDWYAADFTDSLSLQHYLNQFADDTISDSTSIEYLDYDWKLNQQSPKLEP
jgi:hypothetical protein